MVVEGSGGDYPKGGNDAARKHSKTDHCALLQLYFTEALLMVFKRRHSFLVTAVEQAGGLGCSNQVY